MKKFSKQLMREGAFLTHQQRRDRTEASILRSIQRLKDSGLKPSKAAVSRLCNLSRQHISEHYSHLFRNSFNFIDLFAGIGGMRLGFEKAGGRCVFTSEYDKYPASMYRENFGSEVHGDITKIKASDIPPHDVLVAGFPCQPFSIAGVSKKNSLGRSHGFSCKTQGTLFFDVARILEHHRPKMFLLENVKNLRSHDKGRTFRVIVETLEELGYMVSSQVIDASLRVPQKRERIYIVGARVEYFSTAFTFPQMEKKHRTLADILIPVADSKYTLSDKLWGSLQAHAEKHRKKGNGFGYGLCTGKSVSRTLSARYYKDGSEILIDQPGRNPRRLTPRECGLLMGFPEDFKIPLSDTRAYKCFGNSVVVPVIEELAKGISGHLETSGKTGSHRLPKKMKYDTEHSRALF